MKVGYKTHRSRERERERERGKRRQEVKKIEVMGIIISQEKKGRKEGRKGRKEGKKSKQYFGYIKK